MSSNWLLVILFWVSSLTYSASQLAGSYPSYIKHLASERYLSISYDASPPGALHAVLSITAGSKFQLNNGSIVATATYEKTYFCVECAWGSQFCEVNMRTCTGESNQDWSIVQGLGLGFHITRNGQCLLTMTYWPNSDTLSMANCGYDGQIFATETTCSY